MDRSLPLFVLGLIFGGGIGFAIAASMGVTFDGHDHADPAHHGAEAGADHAKMHENPIEVAPAQAPGLALDLSPDPVAGYNLRLMTENFTFSPVNSGGAHVPGEGHAHLYVNGRKVARIYGEWMHLDGLPKGEVEVTVSLTANDHRPFAVDGTPVTATQTLTVE